MDEWILKSTRPHTNQLVHSIYHIYKTFTDKLIKTHKQSLGQGNIFTPVCHSVHRGEGGMCGCWGACMVALGGMCGCSGGACVVALGGDVHGCSGGMHGCSGGVGGMHGCSGGHVWLLLGGRGCAWLLPGGHALGMMRYDQWASGTHPTGMHSCYIPILATINCPRYAMI